MPTDSTRAAREKRVNGIADMRFKENRAIFLKDITKTVGGRSTRRLAPKGYKSGQCPVRRDEFNGLEAEALGYQFRIGDDCYHSLTGEYIKDVCFSPDGLVLAMLTHHGNIVLRDMDT